MQKLIEKIAIYAILSIFCLIFYQFVGFEVSVILILLVIMIK